MNMDRQMLQNRGHYVYFPGPECEAVDQAYACLYLASRSGESSTWTGPSGLQWSISVSTDS